MRVQPAPDCCPAAEKVWIAGFVVALVPAGANVGISYIRANLSSQLE